MNSCPGQRSAERQNQGPGIDLEAPSATARVKQAARAESPIGTLRELAHDSDILVRAAVAINRGCSSEIDTILAGDKDERIRALLGCRIARLLPDLDGKGQDSAARHVVKLLTALARDHARRVRATIAEEVKTMAAAPHDLILLLAQDEVAEVSDPVLRLSPVLTDADLLKLIATPPNSRAAEAIASRSELGAAVADAIVAYADAPAIRTLLANQSACIQEATLDALVGRAPCHTEWHAPLVQRPNLSSVAIRTLSEFVEADLLRLLAIRVDLDPAKLEIVRQRLASNEPASDERSLLLEVQREKERGNVTEDRLLDAATVGHSRRVAVLLAVAAGVSVTAIDRVIELRSAKALVSLTWRAGFTMRAGSAVQTILAHFSPDHLLMPTVSGGFPLSQEEMEWQMELMEAIVAPAGAPG